MHTWLTLTLVRSLPISADCAIAYAQIASCGSVMCAHIFARSLLHCCMSAICYHCCQGPQLSEAALAYYCKVHEKQSALATRL